MAHPSVIILRALFQFSLLGLMTSLAPAPAPTDAFGDPCVPDVGNTTLAHRHNLELLLSDFNSSSLQKNYLANGYGSSPDTVYALYMCWGYPFNPQECQTCVTSLATPDEATQCNYPASSTSLSDACVFLFTDISTVSNFSATYAMGKSLVGMGTSLSVNVSNYQEFNPVLSSTLEALVNDTAFKKTEPTGFATKDVNVTKDQRIHSVAQCTPDTTGVDCRDCLRYVIDQIRSSFDGREEAMYITPYCQIRYNSSSLSNNLNEAVGQPPTSGKGKIEPVSTQSGKEEKRSNSGVDLVKSNSYMVMFLVLFMICIK